MPMRLRTIALDYDGTIATDGVLHPAVRDAIEQARRRGLVVVIVTGRILSDLRAVAGNLDFVDGIVAENGAVVFLPNGYTTALGQVPPPSLLTELTNQGVKFQVGRCVVEMDADLAHVAISLIRKLELPLAIEFNRNRMMLLPDSISKASGLRELFNILGVSLHNAVGIGDAENDHGLIDCCEYGVAVEWGSYLLKQKANYVISGNGPEAVAAYIQELSSQDRMSRVFVKGSQHKLVLEVRDGEPSLEVAIRGRNVLVAGDSRSGKSSLAGLLCEQMILSGYTVYVFDPEGDYDSLATLPNTIMFGSGRLLPRFDDLKMLLPQGSSLILNLSHLGQDEKRGYLVHHLPLVAQHRRSQGYPHRILLDECHYFLNRPDCDRLLDPELDAYTLVTYRPSQLTEKVRRSFGVVLATRFTNGTEVDSLQGLAGTGVNQSDWQGPLASLAISEAALLPPTEEAHGEMRRFAVAPRLTDHVRHRTKYFDVPVAIGKVFVFTDNGMSFGESAATLRELAERVRRVPSHVVDGHFRRHDFSRWIADQFTDNELARTVRQLESLRRANGPRESFGQELAAVIDARYGSGSERSSI
jgi:hydroxymethylpyrimidine pyrophosphatase-like HAD family hydrolase